jgi:nucleoside phosphorylase
MQKIIVFAALPEELGPLRKALGTCRLLHRTPVKTYACISAAREILLVETGMGRVPLLKALDATLDVPPPDLVLSVGFAGSLGEGAGIGDVFIGTAFHTHGTGSVLEVCSDHHFEMNPCPELLGFSQHHRMRGARIVTVASMQRSKPALAALFADTLSLVDMESYFVASRAHQMGVPFLCFRAVSDGLHDEIDMDLEAITGRNGRVRVGKVVREVIIRPYLLKSFHTAWKRSRRAASGLAGVVSSLLRLSVEDLDRIGVKARVRRGSTKSE